MLQLEGAENKRRNEITCKAPGKRRSIFDMFGLHSSLAASGIRSDTMIQVYYIRCLVE